MIMKKTLLAILLLGGMFASCKKVLEIDDLEGYSPEQVWNDENLANAFITNIYPMFGNWSPGLEQKSEQMAGIFFYPDRVTITNDEFKSWNYTRIRLINEAATKVVTGGLKQDVKDRILGQALFMRAYAYFDMVTYHGGVPYITKPQDIATDDLNTPRNTTKECFDLIIKDLDDAIAKLPPKIATSSADYGRIDGAFALAFKAKVLLYKASPQFNPSNPWGNAYWAEAYTANKKAYDDLKALGIKLVDDYSNIALQEKIPKPSSQW